jgi:hypothetical protein
MARLPKWLPLVAGLSACAPYPNRVGDYYAGPMDGSKFPAAYRGDGASATAFGTILPAQATVAGQPVGYYAFPMPAIAEPLILKTDRRKRPLVYVFGADDPSRDSQVCQKPSEDYVFDQRRDAVRFDRQGNVFQQRMTSSDPATLPSDTGYLPVYEEVPVVANGIDCQGVKSAEGLVRNDRLMVETVPPKVSGPNTHPTGVGDGKFLAWAVLDPVALVALPDLTLDPNTGLGPQRWGWFDHLLAAYLDGGYVPVDTRVVPGMMGEPDQMQVVARAQTLYTPNTVRDPQSGAPAPGGPGSGHDVLEGRRGEPAYSPICHVRTFTPADLNALPTDVAQIDPASLDPDQNLYLFCLQVVTP